MSTAGGHEHYRCWGSNGPCDSGPYEPDYNSHHNSGYESSYERLRREYYYEHQSDYHPTRQHRFILWLTQPVVDLGSHGLELIVKIQGIIINSLNSLNSSKDPKG